MVFQGLVVLMPCGFCSFVIKTLEEEGGKLFINVCHARQVPAPGNWSQGKVSLLAQVVNFELQRCT